MIPGCASRRGSERGGPCVNPAVVVGTLCVGTGCGSLLENRSHTKRVIRSETEMKTAARFDLFTNELLSFVSRMIIIEKASSVFVFFLPEYNERSNQKSCSTIDYEQE